MTTDDATTDAGPSREAMKLQREIALALYEADGRRKAAALIDAHTADLRERLAKAETALVAINGLIVETRMRMDGLLEHPDENRDLIDEAAQRIDGMRDCAGLLEKALATRDGAPTRCTCASEALNMLTHGRLNVVAACTCAGHVEAERCDCGFCRAVMRDGAGQAGTGGAGE